MIKHRSRRPAKHRKVDQSAKQSAESTHHGPAEPTQHGIVLHFLTSKSVRETVESVVIAFALAFLFRTFEAEAFVIPTGSMAPTLQGRHQDVDCPMCGNAYRI
ncbi:MAG: S26 family signal peptidase, partial [Pirellulales bacterium]|nr:S26 family signal peptidase [Pirellulales bacterium]